MPGASPGTQLKRAGRRFIGWTRWLGFYGLDALLRLTRPRHLRVPLQPWRLSRQPARLVQRYEAPPAHAAVRPMAYGAVQHPDFDGLLAGGIRYAPVDLVVASDLVVMPGHLFVTRDGMLLRELWMKAVIPHPVGVRAIGGSDYYRLATMQEQGRGRTVTGTVFVADTYQPKVYGHVLLEVLPKLLMLEGLPKTSKVLTSVRMTPAYFSMCQALGVDAERIVEVNAPLFCEGEVYLPDPLVRIDEFVHPLAREAFDRLGRLAARSSISRPERIFVSRAGVRAVGGGRRQLIENAAVEALFEAHGFAVVHPEQLPIEDQVALFAGARMIAGVGGSAMHNAVFAAADCPVFILEAIERPILVDPVLAEAPRRLGYVFGRAAEAHEGGWFDGAWHIDLADVELGLKRHFDL